jgi:hypothetical protein
MALCTVLQCNAADICGLNCVLQASVKLLMKSSAALATCAVGGVLPSVGLAVILCQEMLLSCF